MCDLNDINMDKNIKEILDNVTIKQGFSKYEIEYVEHIKMKGLSGNILKVRIINKDELKLKQLHIVIKMAIKNDSIRAQVPIANIYNREIYFYNTVIPLFETFEKQKNLSPSIFTPKLYDSDTTCGSELFVVENLCASKFTMYNGKIPMDHDHISLLLHKYGRLHALSLAIKHQSPEKFKIFYETMNDNFIDVMKNSIIYDGLIAHWGKCLKLLSSVLQEKDLRIFQNFVQNIPKIFDNVTDLDDYSVIIHGDGWTNNFMFKYQENADATKPIDVRLLDFQISRLGSPALDLSYFIYSCGSEEILDKVDDYLHLYYDSLSSSLEQLGDDAEKLFPYSAFEKQWQKYTKYGLMMAFLAIYLTLSETDEVINLDGEVNSGRLEKDAIFDISNIDLYKDRIHYIVNHFIKMKYID